jgi:hypothetical protein
MNERRKHREDTEKGENKKKIVEREGDEEENKENKRNIKEDDRVKENVEIPESQQGARNVFIQNVP